MDTAVWRRQSILTGAVPRRNMIISEEEAGPGDARLERGGEEPRTDQVSVEI